eukprot:6201070-Pleurochrysis_carterae.AAC.1
MNTNLSYSLATDQQQATYKLAHYRRSLRGVAASCFCGIAVSEPDTYQTPRCCSSVPTRPPLPCRHAFGIGIWLGGLTACGAGARFIPARPTDGVLRPAAGTSGLRRQLYPYHNL